MSALKYVGYGLAVGVGAYGAYRLYQYVQHTGPAINETVKPEQPNTLNSETAPEVKTLAKVLPFKHVTGNFNVSLPGARAPDRTTGEVRKFFSLGLDHTNDAPEFSPLTVLAPAFDGSANGIARGVGVVQADTAQAAPVPDAVYAGRSFLGIRF